MALNNQVSQAVPPTQDEDLTYVSSMLRELHPMAAAHDALLASLIEMARVHATDILSGAAKAETKISRSAVKAV